MTSPIHIDHVIGVAELRHLLEADPTVQLLDVRTGGEFEGGHIPGSFNVPLDTLKEHVRDLAAVDHPVVLVCQSGQRASQAHSSLQEAGKGGLSVLDGGMNAWLAAGGDVARSGTDRWALDRQVRLVAGSLVAAGILTSLAVPKAKWLAGAVGGGLVFSAVSNTCAMGELLGKLPYNRTGCDIEAVIEQIEATARLAA